MKFEKLMYYNETQVEFGELLIVNFVSRVRKQLHLFFFFQSDFFVFVILLPYRAEQCSQKSYLLCGILSFYLLIGIYFQRLFQITENE